MSKRIVVGLDPSDYCKTAIMVACARAKFFEGTVVGVGVVDLPGIERASKGAGPGSGSYARRSRERRIKESQETVEGLLADFTKTCEGVDVAFETEHHACDPLEAIIDASMSADLIVAGLKSSIYYDTHEAPGETVRSLLDHRICPVLAVPETLTWPVKRVIFPYDASPAASLAMRQFATNSKEFPPFEEIILLRVENNPEVGLKTLARPSQYLESYGWEPTLKVLPGWPVEVVPEFVHERLPAVVVLGASTKGSISRLLFGSVTQALIDDGTIPLFLSA